MVSDKFRHQLRKEVEQWQAEGLIEASLYDRLAERYQFNNLDTSARNLFITILMGLGSILLGLGVITFVAANWQVWTREFKVLLLVFVFVCVNVAGFYLWRDRNNNGQKRLGQGLLLLGALLLGANMGLMSQMFHQTGTIYELFLVWGLGVLTMAYSLNLNSLGILSVILVGIAYAIGIPLNLWDRGDLSSYQLAIEHMPLLVSFLFVPLAYRCRSGWLFGLSALLAVYSFIVNSGFVLFNSSVFMGISSAIAYCLPVALLWAYSDRLWNNNRPTQDVFASIARNLAIFGLSILFYWFSFNWIWEDRWSLTRNEIPWFGSNLINILVFVALTIYAWWRLGYRNSSRWRTDRHSTFIGAGLIISSGLFSYQTSVGILGSIATTIFNFMLLWLAIELIKEALATGTRRGFWGGIILLVLQICSRMLEYDTGLFLKAIVLVMCGIGVIFAGLWFERYIQSLNSTN
jgi:uncharacterized membrane protein